MILPVTGINNNSVTAPSRKPNRLNIGNAGLKVQSPTRTMNINKRNVNKLGE